MKKDEREGTSIKKYIDTVALVLTIGGVLFIAVFIQQTLQIPFSHMKTILSAALIIVVITQVNFQFWIARWLNPLVAFINAPPTTEEYNSDRERYRKLLLQAIRYPFRHISLSIASWSLTGIGAGAASFFLGAMLFEEAIVTINTVIFSSIVINMIAYGSVRRIISPVVRICAIAEGDDFAIPADESRSVRERIMIFVGAIIIFLLLFFLQLLFIASVSSTRGILQTQAEFFLDRLENRLASEKEPTVDSIAARVPPLPPGLMAVTVHDEQGREIYPALDGDLIASSAAVAPSSALFAPLIVVKETTGGLRLRLTGDWREFTSGFLQYSPFYVIFILLSCFMALSIGRQIASDIATSMDDIGESMRAISQGEGDLTRRIIGFENREIVNLSHWFNRFISRLSELVGANKTLGTELTEFMGKLRNRSMSFIQESREQEIMFREMMQSTSIFSSFGKSSSDSLTRGHRLSRESLKIAGDSGKSLEQTVKNVSLLAETTKKDVDSLEALLEKAGKMMEIMDIVEGLADQTRLLAFNAMLEAVSAGDSGIRFSVVASEVQTLSDDISSATRNIRAIIAETFESLEIVLGNYRQGQKEISELSTRMSASGEEFHKLLNNAEQTGETIGTVLDEIEQQRKVVHEAAVRIEKMLEKMKKFSDFGAIFQNTITEIDRIVRQQALAIDRFKIIDKQEPDR